MSNESSQLESSSLSIIQKFLDSEIRGEINESKESPKNHRITANYFETIFKDCKKRHDDSDAHFQISELKIEQQNFEAELEFIQKQLIQEINFLMKKIIDKNQLFYKQQELQLQQMIQRRSKQQSPYQSFYVTNPNLQQYQQYNKEIKENLSKLLQAIKQDRVLKVQQPQQAQTSRSPLSQLSKFIQRQASIEKPNNIKVKNNYQLNLVLPSRRDTQSFWNQPSERKCSVASKRIHSPYEKKEKGNVQQALFKQSSDFLKFRC